MALDYGKRKRKGKEQHFFVSFIYGDKLYEYKHTLMD